MRPREGRGALAAPASRLVRVRVAAALSIDDRLLLVRQSKGGDTYHLLPGGGVEYGEPLARALVREVLEETGLDIEPLSLLFVNDTIDPTSARHVVNITFHARVLGGSLAPPHERDDAIEALDLVATDDLEALDLRPPIGAELATAMRQGFAVIPRYLGARWSARGGSVTDVSDHDHDFT